MLENYHIPLAEEEGEKGWGREGVVTCEQIDVLPEPSRLMRVMLMTCIVILGLI